MIKMPPAIAAIDGARMLLQVHDELVFEVPDSSAEALIDIVTKTMERAASPAVQISVLAFEHCENSPSAAKGAQRGKCVFKGFNVGLIVYEMSCFNWTHMPNKFLALNFPK